jgi:hypothetical protein
MRSCAAAPALNIVLQARRAWLTTLAGDLWLDDYRVYADTYGGSNSPITLDGFGRVLADPVGCYRLLKGRGPCSWEQVTTDEKFVHCIAEGRWALDYHDFATEPDVSALIETIIPFSHGVSEFLFDSAGESDTQTITDNYDSILKAARLMPMTVMVSNNCSGLVHHWATKYPGAIGHLYSPEGFREPSPWIPFALDNGAWTCHIHNRAFDERAFLQMLTQVKELGVHPRWVVVPDAVGDRRRTLEMWKDWEIVVEGYGFPKAFAVQDGMVADDVPPGAEVIFVGGSTEWKAATIRSWCQHFPHVHVGRVNRLGGKTGLLRCHAAGAASCDSTAWFRGKQRDLAELETYLRWTAGEILRPIPEDFRKHKPMRLSRTSSRSTDTGTRQLTLFAC